MLDKDTEKIYFLNCPYGHWKASLHTMLNLSDVRQYCLHCGIKVIIRDITEVASIRKIITGGD